MLVTRAAGQCDAVVRLAEQRGATAICFPCLAVQCLPDKIREGLAALTDDAAILLSSANGANCAAQALGADFTPLFSRHVVIAVGGQTAAALSAHGIDASWVAPEASQEGLIQGFAEHGLPARVWFLRAEEGRDVLQQALHEQGVDVQMVHAYRTICPDDDASDIVQALERGTIDAVLLGSSRTAAHYVQRIGNARLANRPAVAVISPQVAAAARAEGLSVQAVAKEASFVAMLDALAEYFAGKHFAESRSAVEEKRP
jgi:uroporphyrinogen-III synthase